MQKEEKTEFSKLDAGSIIGHIENFKDDAAPDFHDKYWRTLAIMSVSHCSNMAGNIGEVKGYAITRNLTSDDYENLLQVGLLLELIQPEMK